MEDNYSLDLWSLDEEDTFKGSGNNSRGEPDFEGSADGGSGYNIQGILGKLSGLYGDVNGTINQLSGKPSSGNKAASSPAQAKLSSNGNQKLYWIIGGAVALVAVLFFVFRKR